MLTLLKPFTEAKNNNKKIIVGLLDEGRLKEETFDNGQLLARLPVDMKPKDMQQVLEGYYSVRIFADTAYELLNRSYRRELEADDVKYINGEGFDALAKPVPDHRVRELRVAFDPETNTLVPLSSERVQKLLDNGVTFYESRHLHGASKTEKTKYIIVKGSTKVEELPEKVLKYREGYLPRVYKEQYFITTAPKKMQIDGKTVAKGQVPKSTVMVAKSKKEANALVAKIREENPDVDVDFKNSRELTGAANRLAELDLEHNTGGLFFGKRGEHLKDVNNALAETEDVVGSIMRTAISVSRKVELEPTMDLMKRRWMNTFGDLTQGQYPRTAGVIVDPEKVMTEEVAKARAMWGYINQMENSALVSNLWQNSMFRFGEWLEDTMGAERLGSAFRTTLSDRDPFSAAKGATFIATIVLNPFRQFFIQAQQYLFLSGIDPTYVLSGKSSIQALPVMLGQAALHGKGFRLNHDALAKVAGMTRKEYDQAVKDLDDSGLIEAIDSHLIGRDAVLSVQRAITEGVGSRVVQGSRNALSGAVGAVREAGFDFGERVNIAHTYMIAKRRFARNNPGVDITSKEAKFKIAADTRQLALGMTQAGALGYQRGILSLATQFLSIQHKAALAMMRGVPGLSHFGNRALTETEGRRILYGQFALYGLSGLGLAKVVDSILSDSGIELPQEAKNVLYGGMYDLSANAILGGLTGDSVDLEFANNIAAGSGWQETLTRTIGDVASGDRTLFELFAGPSRTPFSKLGEAVSITGDVLAAGFKSDEPVSREEVTRLLDSWGRIASGYSNHFIKGEAMKNTLQWVDANGGALGIPASETEATIAGVLGIQGYKVDGFYDYVVSAKEHRDHLKDVADTYYKRMNRLFARYDLGDDVRTFEALQRLVQDESKYIMVRHGEKDGEQIMALVGDMIRQRIDNGDGVLLDRISRSAMNGSLGTAYTEIVNNMISRGLVKPEEGQRLIELNEKFYGVDK
jgi:hypothetical protein